jgi:hypothetical protein
MENNLLMMVATLVKLKVNDTYSHTKCETFRTQGEDIFKTFEINSQNQ